MKNKYKEEQDYYIIYINYKDNQLECYVDKEDFQKVSSIKGTWHITNNRKGHVDGVRTKIQKEGVRKQYWMHNMIMSKTDENNVIDHNTLDNRKSNLRELSKKDNATNTSVDKSKTGIRNFTIENGKYRVRIKGISFGYYDTLEEAKIIADRERLKIFPLYEENSERIIIQQPS